MRNLYGKINNRHIQYPLQKRNYIQNNQHVVPGSIFNASFAYLLLTVSGLSFCFFLGFPFDNHNESYIWVVLLKKASLWDALTKQLIGGIETFRPLGMANAWITYRLSGNIYLQQILNWLFAIGSFAILFFNSRNKVLFSVIALVTSVCFFSGYIYLFHLHGVFYGPFQLYVAALLCIAYTRPDLSQRMLAALIITTIIVSLYHTFALPVFCAFLCGYIIRAFRNNNRLSLIILLILLLVTAGFAKLILHSKEFKTAGQLVQGFFASYKMTEFDKFISVLSLLLSIIAVVPLLKQAKERLVSIIVLCGLSGILLWCNIPVIILWIAVCCSKPLLKGNWAGAGLIAVTAILPAASGSGSPTYNVFVIMACVFVTVADNNLLEMAPAFAGKLAYLVVILLACLLPVLKSGVQIPLASSMARPVLAEEEKTHQLQDIIDWKMENKEFVPFNLQFTDTTDLPVNSKNIISRQNRPVARQTDLNFYMDNFPSKGNSNPEKAQHLYITFGDKVLKDRQIVFSVNGKWNGKAYVFR
ncbi:MAG: hypothetical protein ABJB86_19770 [Bacteroidota bacterium]